jgi:hypothetical protein
MGLTGGGIGTGGIGTGGIGAGGIGTGGSGAGGVTPTFIDESTGFPQVGHTCDALDNCAPHVHIISIPPHPSYRGLTRPGLNEPKMNRQGLVSQQPINTEPDESRGSGSLGIVFA